MMPKLGLKLSTLGAGWSSAGPLMSTGSCTQDNYTRLVLKLKQAKESFCNQAYELIQIMF